MSSLTLKKDLRIAIPFAKRKFSLVFRLFDYQHSHSLGSVSRFFLKKLREGYNLQSISKAIPFDTTSIVQRLVQLNFVKNDTVTDTGNLWASCLDWHEKNFEAWVCMDSSRKIILPADTELLQDFDSLDISILRRPPPRQTLSS